MGFLHVRMYRKYFYWQRGELRTEKVAGDRAGARAWFPDVHFASHLTRAPSQ